jgi:hypothetical protein
MKSLLARSAANMDSATLAASSFASKIIRP